MNYKRFENRSKEVQFISTDRILCVILNEVAYLLSWTSSTRYYFKIAGAGTRQFLCLCSNSCEDYITPDEVHQVVFDARALGAKKVIVRKPRDGAVIHGLPLIDVSTLFDAKNTVDPVSLSEEGLYVCVGEDTYRRRPHYD